MENLLDTYDGVSPVHSHFYLLASDLHKIQTAVDPLISLKETIIFALKRGKNPASENPQVEIKKILDLCSVL